MADDSKNETGDEVTFLNASQQNEILIKLIQLDYGFRNQYVE